MTRLSTQKHRQTAIILGTIVVVMLAVAYASVPLYRIFCQKTGFGGTPQVATAASHKLVNSRTLTIQFTATVHRDLLWEFKPLQYKTQVKVGENSLAFYRAKNLSKTPIVGMATYNVTPDKAGQYFNKVSCFCFEAQRLEAGQEAEMPVLFFISPEFASDPNLKDVQTITLSYTFFKFKESK
jgi:cytochrome c oxidase assembly protein subunit 11